LADANVNHVRHYLYSSAIAQISTGSSLCSGFMLSSDLLVTAHHCTASGPNIFATFFPNWTLVDSPETNRLIAGLGFGAAHPNFSMVRAQVLAPWQCASWFQPPGLDIHFYVCEQRVLVWGAGLQFSVGPGDVFGHLDVTHVVPSNGASTNNLTVNRRLSNGDPWRVLLSPGGNRHVSAFHDNCAGYSDCRGTRNADALPGSSGGATLRGSDNRVWGALFGHSPSTGNDPRPQGGFGNRFRDLWAPFPSSVYSVQFPDRVSDVPAPTMVTLWPGIGGSGGNPVQINCEPDEIVVGLFVSVYRDVWNPTAPYDLPIGNVGAICEPVADTSLPRLQQDHARAITPGSHDTSYVSSLGSSALRFNRYRNTVLSTMGLDPHSSQPWVRCPGGYGVSGLTGRVKFGRLRAITELRCRPYFGSGSEISINTSHLLGTVETGSVQASYSCGAVSRIASGLNLRMGWFVDQLALRCRA
jgi:hypothetical protein